MPVDANGGASGLETLQEAGGAQVVGARYAGAVAVAPASVVRVSLAIVTVPPGVVGGVFVIVTRIVSLAVWPLLVTKAPVRLTRRVPAAGFEVRATCRSTITFSHGLAALVTVMWVALRSMCALVRSTGVVNV